MDEREQVRLNKLNGPYTQDDPLVRALLMVQHLPMRAKGFSAWLFRQEGRDHRVGDLATEMRMTPGWPMHATHFRSFYDFLQRIDAYEPLITSLAIAWIEYVIHEWDDDDNYDSMKEMISAALRWAVWERDDFTCKACGTRRNLSIDHIVAESKGGAMTIDNLQTLCRPCNSRKGAR